MQAAVADVAAQVGVTKACRGLGVPRSSYYRARRSGHTGSSGEPAAQVPVEPTSAAVSAAPPAARSPRASSPPERARVRDVLNSERFADCAPREVYASLLDEGS